MDISGFKFCINMTKSVVCFALDKTPLGQTPCPYDKSGQNPPYFIFNFFSPKDGVIYVNKINSSDGSMPGFYNIM